MPLTIRGKSMLKKFNEEYGENGEDVFYAWLNKKSKKDRKIYEK
jgi:hypothetical protein